MFTDQEIRDMLIKGSKPADIAALIREAAAESTVKAPPASKSSGFERVGCAYGACKARFLPHGVGSLQHSSCAEGRAASKVARATRKAGLEQAAKAAAKAARKA